MAPKRCFSEGRTDTGQYVNFSAAERQKMDQSGKLKAFCLIGVSFCLLCIIQVTLNVTLGIHGAGVCNSSDVTGLLETQQLELELELLNSQLRQKEAAVMTLQKERDSLLGRISELESGGSQCHGGWRPFRSSCYRLSKWRETWRFARRDCKKRGAHLVILSDAEEEEFLRTLGVSVAWIGAYASQPSCPGSGKMWTWVDGRPLTEEYRLQKCPCQDHLDCVSAQTSSNGGVTWVPASCGEAHHWVCEKLKS